MQYELLPAVKTNDVVFWIVKPCGLVDRTCYFHGQGRICTMKIDAVISSKSRFFLNSNYTHPSE
jgi:hypothetical protein